MPPQKQCPDDERIEKLEVTLWGGQGITGLEQRFAMMHDALQHHLVECTQRANEAAREAKAAQQQARQDTRKLQWTILAAAISVVSAGLTALVVAYINQWFKQ